MASGSVRFHLSRPLEAEKKKARKSIQVKSNTFFYSEETNNVSEH